MSLITPYLAQRTTMWLNEGVVDKFGRLERREVAGVSCRFEFQRRVVKSREGAEVVSNAQIFTASFVTPDDLIADIDGVQRTIKAVETTILLNGTVNHYEVLL